MFGISVGEILVIAVVGIFAIRPDDVPKILKQFKILKLRIKSHFMEMKKCSQEIIDDITDDIDMEIYDVSESIKLDTTRVTKNNDN